MTINQDLLFDRKPRSTQNAFFALLHFVDCDTTDSSCNESLVDNDFLFAKKLRSTGNVNMIVQQLNDCDSIDSGCRATSRT